MRRIPITTTILIAIAFLLWLYIFSPLKPMKKAFAYISATSTTKPTPTTNPQRSSSTNNAIDPTLLAAIIAGGSTLTAAIIAGAVVIYQVRHTIDSEHKRQAEQLRHEEEILRLQRELEVQSRAKEQEEQREDTKAENLRIAALLAKTNEERLELYRKALHTDPRISCLQILSMSRPLNVADIYVRVRLHEDARLSYELDPILLTAESEHDPNALLRAGEKFLESRVISGLDPDEAIRRYTHCVIVGDPGAGKTTLLKYLALKAADKQLTGLPDIPIHISLHSFVNSGFRDLLDFTSTIWDERYGFPQADARIYMDDILKKGQAILLLDALDETVTGLSPDEAESSYKRVADAIVQLKTRYSQSPIVVTARKAGYQGRAPLVGFTELEVLDFRQEDIEQFVNKWFVRYQDPHKQANAVDLNTRLERNLRIRALGANPLLLSLIVLVYEAQLDLPDRRAKLYERCIDILLTEWDTSRSIQRRREFKPEYKQQLLEELAWHFHLKGQRYFPDSEVKAVIGEFLPAVGLPAEQNGKVLEEIANENGLLKAQAQGWHGFLHLTLQEYFVAKYVTDHHKLEELLTHRGDPWWEEVIQLYAGQTPDASSLLQKLLRQGNEEALREDLFHTNLILAGRCLAARPTIRQTFLRQEVTSRLFDLLTTTPYSLTREQVANTLAAIGGIEVNAGLLKLLSDQHLSIFIRKSSAQAIGQLGDRSVVPELLRLLFDQQLSPGVRQSIALGLGQLGDRSVVPKLLQLLLLPNQHLDTGILWSCAQALGQLGDRSVVPQLVSLLSDRHLSIDVRKSIASALGQLGDSSAIPTLLRLLSDQHLDSDVRQSIASALGELGDRSVVPQLVPLLSDQHLDSDVRQSIALILGQLGDRSVVPQLVPLLSDQHLDLDVRQGIASALGELGDRSVVPELLRLLSDQHLDLDVRQRIALILGQLGERSVVPELLRLLSDQHLDLDVRQGIALALGELGDRSVVPELLRLLSDQHLDLDVRQRIALVLGQLGDRSVVPELLRLLSDQFLSSYVRWSIAYTFSRLGDRSVIPDLLQLLSEQKLDLDVFQEVTRTVERLVYDEATVEALANLSQTLSAPALKHIIYRALWTISLQLRVRVLAADRSAGKQIEIAKW
ncbi:MAG: HEAT repeat domain-containing protein [Ktedonobacteraceae bacterium]